MTERLQVYKCEVCGNIVEVVHSGAGELVCCGEPMKLQVEKTADKATEKHVPVVEKTAKGYKVTVGTTLHPMEEDHYIEWIELVADGAAYRQFLKPGDPPGRHLSRFRIPVRSGRHQPESVFFAQGAHFRGSHLGYWPGPAFSNRHRCLAWSREMGRGTDSGRAHNPRAVDRRYSHQPYLVLCRRQ